ncbi:exported hypothetical protein [Agrobacterium fabacearum S56]|nr:exported hypothetical protein [Agrobacterium fabacearum S56]
MKAGKTPSSPPPLRSASEVVTPKRNSSNTVPSAAAAGVMSLNTHAAKTIARATNALADMELNAAIESFPAPK